MFYQSTPFLSGIEEEFGKLPSMAGVGLISGIGNLKTTEIWDKRKSYRNSILSLVLSGKFSLQ